MISENSNPPSQAPISAATQLRPGADEIAQAVREELSRRDQYLQFAQGQIEEDRKFYKHLYSYAVAFLGFMVLVAGYFSYSSVSQMRSDMDAAVNAELSRDK